jgi:hypothetical protein
MPENPETTEVVYTDRQKKGTRSRPAKVKKHAVTTAYKNDVAEKLDKLDAAGHTILAITSSQDFRGFEIISYTEE